MQARRLLALPEVRALSALKPGLMPGLRRSASPARRPRFGPGARLASAVTQASWAACAAFALGAPGAQAASAAPRPAAASAADADPENALPYMPSLRARHAIQLLVDEAHIPLLTTHWPLPAHAVREALEQLPDYAPAPWQAAYGVVDAELRAARRGLLRASLRNPSEAAPGYGDNYSPGSSASLQGPAWRWGQADAAQGNSLSARLGARVEQNADPLERSPLGQPLSRRPQLRLEGSALVAQLGGVNLQAFSRQNWWSPGWQSSLPTSSNAPAWNGLGLQRSSSAVSASPWLRWLGPWNFELFVAKAQDPIVADAQPQGFAFTGSRLTFQPTPGLEVGLTRTIQSGGKGAPGGLGNWLKAMSLSASNLNSNDPTQQIDVANEMAGFDLRLSCLRWGLRCAAYAQWYADDSANAVPTKYGSVYGLEGWSADGRYRWIGEYTDTRVGGGLPSPRWQTYYNVYYLNHAYPQGYSNGGRWAGSAFGSDSRVLTLGWYDAEQGLWLKAHAGRIGHSLGNFNGLPAPAPAWYTTNNGCSYTTFPCGLNQGPYPAGRLLGLSLQQSLAWRGLALTPELDWTHLSDGSDMGHSRRNNLRLGLTVAMPLGEPSWGQRDGFYGGSRSTLNQDGLLADLGATARSVARQMSAPGSASAWGWAAGALLVSTSLDRPLDRWALQHPGGTAHTLGQLGSAVPVLLGLGVALDGLGAGPGWLGASSDTATSWSALKAGALTLAANTALRYSLGRARPQDKLGPHHFNSLGSGASQSGLPSHHVGLAFALLTPYAQRYDAPWLYGLGAFTALARIQGRQHWASDTVAAGMLGYAIGSAVGTHDGEARGVRPARVAWTGNGVVGEWVFQ